MFRKYYEKNEKKSVIDECLFNYSYDYDIDLVVREGIKEEIISFSLGTLVIFLIAAII